MRRLSLVGSMMVVVLLGMCAAGVAADTSLADEVAAGQAVVARLQSGEVGCAQLSDDDFDHIGEYVMNGMVGSLARHEALNARMTAVMGAGNEARMHVLMGRRYTGCPGGGATTGAWMGPGMMGGGGPWGRMMGSDMWNWMSDGNWQQMSGGDWRRVSDQWMGPGVMGGRGHHWSATDTAILLGAGLLAAAVLGGVILTRRGRGGASAT